MPKVPIPLPPELEAAASAVLEENAKAPAAEAPDVAGEVIVGPLRFRRPVLGDLETLRLIGSPYYHEVAGISGSVEEFRPDLGAVMDAAFLWSRPAHECRALAAKGAEAFRAVSSRAFLDAPLSVWSDLAAAIEQILARELRRE